MSKKNKYKAVAQATEAVQATTDNIENNIEAVATQEPKSAQAVVIKTPQELLAILAVKARTISNNRKQVTNADLFRYLLQRETGATDVEMYDALMDLHNSDLADVNHQEYTIESKHLRAHVKGFLRDVGNKYNKDMELITLESGSYKLVRRVSLAEQFATQ